MVLPSGCLWTTLRDVEGLTTRLPGGIEEDVPSWRRRRHDDDILPPSVPEAIRNMLGMKAPMEALGAMVWYLRQLNIDKDIMSMGNFNVYDQ